MGFPILVRWHLYIEPDPWSLLLTCEMTFYLHLQGSFFVCAQPMRDNVTLQCRLLLAGRIHNMTPANERRYIATLSLIGWRHTQHDPSFCDLSDIITAISWLRGRHRFSLHTHHDKPWWPLTRQWTRISTLDDVSAKNYVSCYITNHNQSNHFLKMHLSSEALCELSPYFVVHVPGKPHMSQVVEVLSCYLVLLSTDSKTR